MLGGGRWEGVGGRKRHLLRPTLIQVSFAALCMLNLGGASQHPGSRGPEWWLALLLSPQCWPPGTHPAVPAHTEAEGVLVGAARAIVYHALHGHHLPSLLGLAVEVASLLSWKGSSGVLARTAGSTAHFASSFFPKSAQEKHLVKEKLPTPRVFSRFTRPPPPTGAGVVVEEKGERWESGRCLESSLRPWCMGLSFSQPSQPVVGTRLQIPRPPPPQGKGKWVFARFLPEDPLQPTFSETPRCPLIQFPVPGTFPSQQLSQKSLKQKFLLDFLPDHSLPLRRGPCLLWHSLPARPCGAFNRLV